MDIMYNVAVDLSLSSPAVCILPVDEELKPENCNFYNTQGTKKYVGVYCFVQEIKPMVKLPLNSIYIERMPPATYFNSREARFTALLEWFKDVLPVSIKNFFIEGYSMGSVGMTSSICEVGGLIRHHIHKAYQIPIQEFPPKTVKKVFAGAGDAKKDEMIETFIQRTKVDFSKIIDKGIEWDASLITDLTDSFAVMYTGLNQHLIEVKPPKKKKGKK